MKKYSTGIKGLDTLFHGGIQLSDSASGQGVIIAIRGARGCYKTILAMQLMHGLTRSRTEDFKKSNKRIQFRDIPRFYSFNKDSVALNDLYIDLLIIQTIHEYIMSDKDSDCNIESLFDINAKGNRVLYDELGKQYFERNEIDIPILLKKRILYYNSRTNAIHFNVDDDKISSIEIFKRLYNNIEEFEDYSDKFINVQFNTFDERKQSTNKQEANKNATNDSLHKSPIVQFQEILTIIGSTKKHAESVVIDGFSSFTKEELNSLPYNELEKSLRNYADVSILVFDDKVELQMNADIVLDLRSKESLEEEYLYHELKITKSVFQTTALGWHQYKKRDDGIVVFPSLHMLLSKRNYLPHRLLLWDRNILEDTFDDFENNIDFTEKNNRCGDYITLQDTFKSQLLLKIHRTHQSLKQKDSVSELVLEEILKGTINIDSDAIIGWENHYPSTAIIGNPNSYKRQLAISGAFYAAQRKEHTIFVLFDKNEADMRRRICCPGLCDKIIEEGACRKNCVNCSNICDLKDCFNCYKYLHFFQVRMGCISAEEFFDALLFQIEKFSNREKCQPCHIIIDDLQKIDYSFPFLKKTPLFLSTLITICRENFAELKIICDKRANLVGELCSLTDNALCIQREENEINSMTLYIERNLGGIESTGLCKLHVKDTSILFKCDKHKLRLNSSAQITMDKIGSMKEFWRKSYNITEKEHRTITIDNNMEE
ncbi:MAG: hypothetical protein IJZ67_01405 [Alistipes sp.]|nr:hypothetical protein [Alistipes sp.]